jgi:catechol 2,3-dioxygenase-like lactoylglutathione lyase family enzyme
MITLKNIDHVCLWVRSLTESKRYYETLFGVTCTPRDGDAATLVVESEHIHFFMSEAESDHPFLAQQHISFEVHSLDAVIATLKQMGVSDVSTGEVNFFRQRNYKWCEWRDPSGIRLECVEII